MNRSPLLFLLLMAVAVAHAVPVRAQMPATRRPIQPFQHFVVPGSALPARNVETRPGRAGLAVVRKGGVQASLFVNAVTNPGEGSVNFSGSATYFKGANLQ
jgi:hypothetical protein